MVPRVEGRAALACTFSSVKYPGRAPDGFVLLRVFLGGALQEGLLARDDQALVRLAHDDVAGLLGITGAPVLARVWRHPGTMPQYEVGHLDRVAAIEARLEALPGLALAGGAYRGVGIADCVRSGEAAAERLNSSLKGRCDEKISRIGIARRWLSGSASPEPRTRSGRPTPPAGRSTPRWTGSGR